MAKQKKLPPVYLINKEQVKTVADAKAYLKERWWEGTQCLCCNQHVQLYPRQIYDSVAKGLIVLYNLSHDLETWIHVPSEFNNRKMGDSMGDFAKSKAWKLIEEKPKDENRKKTNSGFWRLTQLGIDFVENKIHIPKYLVFYNSKFFPKIKYKENEMITIIDALGTDFNYSELINHI